MIFVNKAPANKRRISDTLGIQCEYFSAFIQPCQVSVISRHQAITFIMEFVDSSSSCPCLLPSASGWRGVGAPIGRASCRSIRRVSTVQWVRPLCCRAQMNEAEITEQVQEECRLLKFCEEANAVWIRVLISELLRKCRLS